MIRYTYVPEIGHCSPDIDSTLHAMVEEFRGMYAKRNTATAYQALPGFINAPFDEMMCETIMHYIQAKQLAHDDVLVVVGIGGSGLGTQAVYQALRHLIPSAPAVIFADTLDPLLAAHACRVLENYLRADKRVVIVISSKSGNTLETIAYSEVLLAILKKYRATNYADDVIVTSDMHSPLMDWARNIGCMQLVLPTIFEGRFTVFSPIGLMPLALLGIDINQLCGGAQQATHELCSGVWQEHAAIRGTCAVFKQYLSGNYLLDFFAFAWPLLGLGGWYRQLIAEGLGKTYQGSKQPSLVPLVTRGSNDLHCMVQLYLGGNMPAFTQFVTVDQWPDDVVVPTSTQLPGAQRYAGKSFTQLMDVLFESTRRAYVKQNKPYVHVAFDELTADRVGYFLQTYMIQMVLLSRLFGVNPYDQPHVELYKKEARALLGG